MYAQLPVADGRFELRQSEGDPRGLFVVVGNFDDAELLSIVSFVRSNSRFSRSADPITHVSRSGDNAVQVQISKGGPHTLVLIRREGQSWVMLKESIVVE